jgi:hypothetical protein
MHIDRAQANRYLAFAGLSLSLLFLLTITLLASVQYP